MVQIAQLIGGAGTGKTSELLNIMEKALADLADPMLLGFCSFTRAARLEAATRAVDRFGINASELEKDGWFKTLHAVCHKCLGIGAELLSDNAESQKWLRDHLQEDVTGETSDYAEAFAGAQSDADKALRLWHAARNRILPLRGEWERASACDHQTPSYERCVAIVERYEQAKRLDGRWDFTDLLCRFIGCWPTVDGCGWHEPEGEPPELPAWFFDEQQDASHLLHLVCQRLISNTTTKWVYVVGDPMQCQPSGTMVRTKEGDKPIEKLDPEKDWIIAYAPKDGNFYGTGKRLKFSKASRMVDSSDIWKIELENGEVLRSTGNHKWFCRYSKPHCFAVYVMRKGNKWRVGTVQMFSNGNDKGASRLAMRTKQENADCSWVLKTFPTDRDARAYEQVVSCRYGLPQVTFRPPCGCKTNLTAEFIGYIFSELGSLDANGERCLNDHDRDLRFPFYSPRSGRRNGEFYGTKVETCNLLPGIARLPRLNKAIDGRQDKRKGVYRTEEMRAKRKVYRRVEWMEVKSIRKLPPGTPVIVWSLDVERHHTYVSDNYVTCNSIYGWAGSDHRLFTGGWTVSKSRVMPKSHRCAAPILALGESILSRCSDYWDRQIAPADHEGVVEYQPFTPSLLEEIDPGESWFVLARTNFQARRVAAMLDAAGIPWIPTGSHGGTWRAPVRNAAMMALIGIEQAGPISGSEWQAVLKHVPSKDEDGTELLVHGTKTWFSSMAAEEAENLHAWVLPDGLGELGATPAFVERVRAGQWRRWIPQGAKFAEATQRWGQELVEAPKLRVGTVHSVKGQDADNVLVLTTISRPCAEAVRASQDGADEEQRVKYVAVTRAKRRVVIAGEQDVQYRWRMT